MNESIMAINAFACDVVSRRHGCFGCGKQKRD